MRLSIRKSPSPSASGRASIGGLAPLLLAIGLASACAEGGGIFETPEGGWPSLIDAGATGGLGAGMQPGAGGTLSGTAGGTLSGTAGGTLSGTAGGSLSGTAGGTLSGSAGGTLSGTAGGTLSGAAGGSLSGTAGGTLSGAAGGSLSGAAGGTLSGTVSGTTGGSLSGSAGGILAGSAGGILAGSAGGSTAGGILAGLGGGLIGGGSAGGSTGGTMPLDPSVKQPAATKLPQVKGTCPNITNGARVTVNGTTAVLTVGSKPGPMVFYWHGTGSDAGESDTGLPGAAADIRANGGVLASFNDSNGQGDNTGDLVWYTGDIESADQLLACAIEKNLVDTGRIYTAGYSAGGLQAGTMVLQRSNYLAAAIVYSGGPPLGGLAPGSTNFVDKSNIPAVLGAHGAAGSDWLILDFHDGTILLEDTVKMAGGFAIDCDDNGSHLDFFTIRAGVGGKAWQFLKDHPYNTRPSPYASGLPSGFPKYCKIR